MTSSSDDPPEHGEADVSPESAAVARGAARTAASGGARATRAAVAGRLPAASRTAAAKASRSIPRAPKIPTRPVPRSMPRSVPRGAPRSLPKPAMPKKVAVPRAPRVGAPRGVPRSSPKLSSRMPKARANTIAKASDRASKGIDVLSAGMEQNQSSGAGADPNAKQSAGQLRKTVVRAMQQLASFGRIFVTNTVLGMAVFATYEEIIEQVAPSSDVETAEVKSNCLVSTDDAFESNTENDNDSELPQTHSHDIEYHTDAMDRATLPQHFFAGAMGGAAHAVLSLGLEVKVNASSDAFSRSPQQSNYTLTNPLRRQWPVQIQVPAMNYAAASILHHSLAHSVLFGSYQLTKRALLRLTAPASPTSGHNDSIHVASIAVAGGVAGQCQHVTSHFTEQLLLTDYTKNSSSPLLRRVASASWPTWRSTMLAFPPSAIGFMAFEYGKFMIAGDN